MALDRVGELVSSALVIAMGSAGWLLNDFVDYAELKQVMRRKLECFSRLGNFVRCCLAPQNSSASLRRYDRVTRVFLHQDHVSHTQGQSSPRSAFSYYAGDTWRRTPGHQLQISGTSLSLATLLGTVSLAINSEFRAMASAWPRSSAPTPGSAPCVSSKVISGSENRSASS